jgi:hypothetical protein
MKLTRDDLLAKLKRMNTPEGEAEYLSEHVSGFIRREELHIDADQALLDFIDDDEITVAFHMIRKWYA